MITHKGAGCTPVSPTKPDLCTICGREADHAPYECSSTAYPTRFPITIAAYQQRAAKTARQDAPAFNIHDRYAIINALNFAVGAARLAERNKKRLFHNKDVASSDVRYRVDDLPENTLESNWLLGLAGEIGELIEAVLGDEGEAAIKEEAGGVLWYLSQLLTSRGLSLEDAGRENLAELDKRHSGEFTEHKK